MRKGFIFDLNKCVGCHACVVACQIENGDIQNQLWREINTFNLYQHPDIPLFHFSLACNHCEDAPCMKNCPALAYTKERGLVGIEAIIHQSDRCIGCKYCTWACPYDAPKFIPVKGVVEKCTLCFDRITKGLKPACANLCPTGALDFGEINIQKPNNVNGFTEVGIKPGLDIIPLRNLAGPENNQKLSTEEQKHFQSIQSCPESKITLKKEWTLVAFTLLTALLTSIISKVAVTGSGFSPFLFAGLGFLGMGLSSIHLGKKTRAWRAVLNVKHSWLSREIFLYSTFIGLSILVLFCPEQKYLTYLAALLGFATLFTIDKVYVIIQKITPLNINSASVFLSGLLFTAFILSNMNWFIFLLVFKLLLYLYRKIYFYSRAKPVYPIISALRIGIGIIAPLSLILFSTDNPFNLIVSLVLLGEVIDRSEFYVDLDVITPKKQIQNNLDLSLNS